MGLSDGDDGVALLRPKSVRPRLAPNPDFNEIAERGTEDVAGDGETLIKSFRLNGTLPGVGGACGWGNRDSVCPGGDGGARSS